MKKTKCIIELNVPFQGISEIETVETKSVNPFGTNIHYFEPVLNLGVFTPAELFNKFGSFQVRYL